MTPRLETDFDVPAVALPVPATLARGDDPALRLVDGLVRGVSLPGRFQHSPGLFGLKVEPPAGLAGITVTFGFDGTTPGWWQSRVPSAVEPRTPDAPRVLVVRAQGRDRGAVLLARPGPEPRTASVSFELDPDELDRDGLLVIEAGPPRAAMPAAYTEVTAAYPAVGVTVTSVELVVGAAVPVPVQTTAVMPAGLLLLGPTPATVLRLRVDTGSGSGPVAAPAQVPGAAPVRLPPAPNVGSEIPHGRPLPPAGPRRRVGRWSAGLRSRLAAESRLNGQGRELRSARPELEVGGQTTPFRELGGPGRPALTGATVLADLLADLVRENRLRIRAVGLYTGGEQTLPVTLRADGELDVAVPAGLAEPTLVRIDAVEDELLAAPELRRSGVGWHLIA